MELGPHDVIIVHASSTPPTWKSIFCPLRPIFVLSNLEKSYPRSDLSVLPMAERVSNKVKAVAKEDFDQARELAKDAVRSAAYLYPFKV